MTQPNTKEGSMKCFIDENEASSPEQEFTEEQFFEQFAAIEEGLALLQIQMRSMSEHAKRFGSIAGQMRRSICPATRSPK